MEEMYCVKGKREGKKKMEVIVKLNKVKKKREIMRKKR